MYPSSCGCWDAKHFSNHDFGRHFETPKPLGLLSCVVDWPCEDVVVPGEVHAARGLQRARLVGPVGWPRCCYAHCHDGLWKHPINCQNRMGLAAQHACCTKDCETRPNDTAQFSTWRASRFSASQGTSVGYLQAHDTSYTAQAGLQVCCMVPKRGSVALTGDAMQHTSCGACDGVQQYILPHTPRPW